MIPNENTEGKAAAKSAEETVVSRHRLQAAADGGSAQTADKGIQVTTSETVITYAPPAREEVGVTPENPPWTLQQFFNGEIDLDVELAKRFPNMPVMAAIYFRSLGTRTGRGVATLSTADSASSVIIDADAATREVQISFTYGSMLTLRFTLDDLSEMDRSRWLELMRREQGGLAFLWGPTRWESDYMICVARKYFTNFYAFSPRSFEAAVRMTPDVTRKLLDWLEQFWKTPPPSDETPKLLTW